MIRIHDPLALILVEAVLIGAALVAAHRITAGRIWGGLWRGLAVRPEYRRTALWLLILPAGAMASGIGTEGANPIAASLARILAGFLAAIVTVAFLLLRQQRRERERRARGYQKQIDAWKGSAAPEAPAAIRGWVQALNRCGVTAVDLTCCRLPGLDLSGTRLYGAKLRGAELTGADLRQTGCTGADLRSARLGDAILRDSFLYRADLRDADLRRADLRGADLREADLRGARLDGCLLEDARLEEARLQGASFNAARMNNTRVTVDQLLKTASLAHARLDPALRASLMAAQDPVPPLSRRLLRLDGTMPLAENAAVRFSLP